MLVRMPFAVIRIMPQASKIIQAYSTNKADSNGVAFVDIKGRIVAMAENFAVNEEESILVFHEKYRDKLFSHLEKYLPLFESKIQPLDWHVYHDTNDSFDGSFKYKIPFSIGSLCLTDQLIVGIEFEDPQYALFRHQNDLPIHGVDFDDTMILNVGSCERYISYDKGCYLGQEIIARVHYKGRAPLKLTVVSENNESFDGAKTTSIAKNQETGMLQGFLFTPNSPS